MWNEISTAMDLHFFMDTICSFHDSCIKELRYLSGAYVNDNLGMHPINDRRILNVIIQRQFEINPMIEMEFEGLKYLKLFPTDENYTCEILDSTMFLKNGCIYWCDRGDLSEEDLENFTGTMICATKIRWRPIKDCMGEKNFYYSVV